MTNEDAPVSISVELELFRKIVSVLRECSEDLEAELRNRYPAEAMKYPGEQRRFERDMGPVEAARGCLATLQGADLLD